MFAESMTEAEVNRAGSASDLRYFHTTYGATFGYNERAKKYHRSYGLVTPPTQAAFKDTPLGPLATAPLYRRDHLGFRRDFPDEQFTWSESANRLKKNQKHYGDEAAAQSPPPALPVRTVQWHGSAAYGPRDTSPEDDALQAHLQQEQAAYHQRQQQQQAHAYEQQRQRADEDAPIPPAPLPANGRAILTSSLSTARLGHNPAGDAYVPPPAPWANTTRADAFARTQAQRQLERDQANPNLYPTPAVKTSPHNPQFDAPRR